MANQLLEKLRRMPQYTEVSTLELLDICLQAADEIERLERLVATLVPRDRAEVSDLVVTRILEMVEQTADEPNPVVAKQLVDQFADAMCEAGHPLSVDEMPVLRAFEQWLQTTDEPKPVAANQLRKALGDLIHAYERLVYRGYERIIDEGGECDSPEVMLKGDPYLMLAREALQTADEPSEAEALLREASRSIDDDATRWKVQEYLDRRDAEETSDAP